MSKTEDNQCLQNTEETTSQEDCQNWLNSKLIAATSNGGNHDYVKTLLEAGAEVNTVDDRTGFSALMYTVKKGDFKTMAVLLEAGADVEYRQFATGTTALMCAANGAVNYTECVRRLIKAGADIYARDFCGQCPLILAASAGHYRIVEYLLWKGKNVHALDDGGRSALSMACVGGHDRTVEILLDHEAEVDFMSDNGVTPLMYAAMNGKVGCLKLLLGAGADESLCNIDGENVIMVATKGHDNGKNCLDFLKEAGASFKIQDLNADNCFGNTPLMYTAYNDEIGPMKTLIDLGADLEFTKRTGETALLIAAKNRLGSPKCVRELLAAGANINVLDNAGNNALMAAASKCFHLIVEVLLEAGMGVNFVNYNGQSAFFLAVQRGDVATIELLIHSGADVNLASNNGTTPLMALFKDRVRMSNKGLIQLLKAGANIDASDNNGETALTHALKQGATDTALFALAQAGADRPTKMSAEHSARMAEIKNYLTGGLDRSDLHHQCRKVIRRHLLWLHENSNLVATVSQLPLPNMLKSYLLYYEPDSSTTRGLHRHAVRFFVEENLLKRKPSMPPEELASININDQVKEEKQIESATIKKEVKKKAYRRMALLCNAENE